VLVDDAPEAGIIRSAISVATLYNRRSYVNKSELIDVIAVEANVPKVAAGKVVDAVVAAIVQSVAKGGAVTLVGFGSFKSSKRAARTGINPKTGAALKIAATTVPRFVAGASFKTAVAGKKAKKK
jgi:DNA-binding protein HU-beta